MEKKFKKISIKNLKNLKKGKKIKKEMNLKKITLKMNKDQKISNFQIQKIKKFNEFKLGKFIYEFVYQDIGIVNNYQQLLSTDKYNQRAILNFQSHLTLLQINPNKRDHLFDNLKLKNQTLFKKSQFFNSKNLDNLIITNTDQGDIDIFDLVKLKPMFNKNHKSIFEIFAFEKEFGILSEKNKLYIFDIRDPLFHKQEINVLQRLNMNDKIPQIVHQISKKDHNVIISSNKGSYLYDLWKNNIKKQQSLNLHLPKFHKRFSISYEEKIEIEKLPKITDKLYKRNNYLISERFLLSFDFINKNMSKFDFVLKNNVKQLNFKSDILDIDYLDKLCLLINNRKQEIAIFDINLKLIDVISINSINKYSKINFIGNNNTVIIYNQSQYQIYKLDYQFSQTEILELIQLIIFI